MKLYPILMIAFGLMIFSACRPDNEEEFFGDGTDVIDINEVEDPNPIDISMAELGRLLFWDPVLSGTKEVACATCHHPDFGYADGRALSLGVDAVGLGPQRRPLSNVTTGFVKRNSPTIINTAFNGMNENGQYDPASAPMFWDNRIQSLELQALEPLKSFEEMRGHAFDESVTLDSIISRLNAISEYRNLFASAFGNANAISSDNIGRAIAAFERSIVATNSPFDRFQAGDEDAMTQEQQRGLMRFNQIGCNDCHSGPMFSDFELHTLGIPDNNQQEEPDTGAGGNFAFRTPTLRNLGETGPYFHNGVGEDIEEVIQFYRAARNFARNGNDNGGPNGGGLNVNPNVNANDIDPNIRNLGNLNNGDIQEIAAFIQALNDPDFDRRIPAKVPSGLSIGGDID